MTLRGERTPFVGRTGLIALERTRPPAPGAWVVLSAKPGETRPLGEAGRPGTGAPGRQAAISWYPRILIPLDVAREWPDLEGDFELESSMGVDLGVLGEGCTSMGVILVVEWKNKWNLGGEGLNEEEGGCLSA